MSHAISQVKAPRALHPAIVIALVVACVVGLCALLVRSLPTATPEAPGVSPAARPISGEQPAPAAPAGPPRVYRDPAAPGRRF